MAGEVCESKDRLHCCALSNPLSAPICLVLCPTVQAGAVAALLADDGSCTEDFVCGGQLRSRAESVQFAARDDPVAWGDIKIPCAFISRTSHQRILRLMVVENITLDEYGEQLHNP